MGEEEFIRNTINLTLTELKAKERWDVSQKVANDNIFTTIGIKTLRYITDAKNIIDDIIGKENKDKINDFIVELILG